MSIQDYFAIAMMIAIGFMIFTTGLICGAAVDRAADREREKEESRGK